MGIGIITNFDVNASKNIDSRLGPYVDIAQATGSINPLSRYIGMTVIITGSGAPVEYWFNPTTANTDLVLKSGGGSVTGGASNYIAVWSGSTALTTGSLYNDTNGVGINNTSPSYSLDINGGLRVTGSSGLIYHQNHKHGAINTTSVTSGSSVTLLEFGYNNNNYPPYYRGLFFDYEIEVIYNSDMKASRSGTLKATIFYKSLGNALTAIQTTENSTPEYHYATSDQYIGTENIVLSVTNTNNQIQLVCSNRINDNQYSSTIRGEWKLLSTI
jgi:hypothetical protein